MTDRKLMFNTILSLFFILLLSDYSLAATEEVYVTNSYGFGRSCEIMRKSGERYLIDVGIGCISLWRYENKKILIHSPGIFGGVGSMILLPDEDQECRIWDSKLLTMNTKIDPGDQENGTTVNSNCDSGHWLRSVSDNGRIIVLEDQTVWEVDISDTMYSNLWLMTESITICGDKMINTDNGETISARQLH